MAGNVNHYDEALGLDSRFKKYLAVRNGQDLVNLGYVPKTSSEYLQLIGLERLKAIRDNTLETITDEMCGEWKPLFSEEQEILKGEVTGRDDVMRYARPDMQVEVTATVDGKKLKAASGVIKSIAPNGNLAVAFATEVPGGHSLNNACEEGHGLYITPSNGVKLIIPDGISIDNPLFRGVKADEKLGDKVRFVNSYRGSKPWEYQSEIPAGAVGILRSYNEEPGSNNAYLEIIIEELPDKNKGTKRLEKPTVIKVSKDGVRSIMEYSSLGQEKPKDKEAAVYEFALQELLPTAVFPTGVLERVAIAMLMQADFYLVGPAGSGKTAVGLDIINLVQQHQGLLFKVNGCTQNCNPGSLYDRTFVKRTSLEACPQCKIEYDKIWAEAEKNRLESAERARRGIRAADKTEFNINVSSFRETGFFHWPEASDVKALVAKWSEGMGYEIVDGSSAIRRTQVAGYKLPDFGASSASTIIALDEKGRLRSLDLMQALDTAAKIAGTGMPKEQSQFDPENFIAGILNRTNNGVLLWDEFDKNRQDAMDYALAALSRRKVKSDDQRFCMPSDQFMILTLNDASLLSDPVDDRLVRIDVDYTSDIDTAHIITRRSIDGDVKEPKEYCLANDLHSMQPLDLESIVLPVIVSKTVDSFYIKFDCDYPADKSGRSGISNSGRSKKTSHLAAKAHWLLRKDFFSGAPDLPDMDDITYGIVYALSSRTRLADKNENRQAFDDISEWVNTQLPELLQNENNNWWCNLTRHMAVSAKQIPEMKDNFYSELHAYEQDSGNAIRPFYEIKKAVENPHDSHVQLAKIKYPFMHRLFEDHVRMPAMSEQQVKALVKTIVDMGKKATCQIVL